MISVVLHAIRADSFFVFRLLPAVEFMKKGYRELKISVEAVHLPVYRGADHQWSAR